MFWGLKKWTFRIKHLGPQELQKRKGGFELQKKKGGFDMETRRRFRLYWHHPNQGGLYSFELNLLLSCDLILTKEVCNGFTTFQACKISYENGLTYTPFSHLTITHVMHT